MNLVARIAARYKDKKVSDKGNPIYQYSEHQVSRRNHEKARRLEGLRKNVTSLRAQVKKDLSSGDPDKVLTALAVGLMDHTAERVGNKGSADDGHFGVTGWEKSHVSFGKGRATVKYVGKSGVQQKKTVNDKALVSALKDAFEACEGDSLFCHDTGTVGASQVNSYLKKFDITAKDLRGLHANAEMQKQLKAQRKGELPLNPKERKVQLKSEFDKALEATAAAVGHEPATLRNQYLVPNLEDEYMQGRVMTKMVKTAARHIQAMSPKIANHVAIRYCLARAIRIDKRGIQELSKELEKIIARKTDGKNPLGKQRLTPRGYPYTVTAVDGSPVPALIVLDTIPTQNPYYVVDGGMGHAGKQIVVVININGSIPIPKNTSGALAKQLYPVLIHELTHVADKFKGRGPAHDLSRDEAQNNAAYYNNPGEVRAYLQEVVDEVSSFFKHAPTFQKTFGNRAWEYILKQSNTWMEISPYLNERNKRLIIKAVVQAYEDFKG